MLLAQYQITAVPTFLLSDDALAYTALMSILPEVGTFAEDRTFVFRAIEKLGDVIYKNVVTGELIGSPQPQ